MDAIEKIHPRLAVNIIVVSEICKFSEQEKGDFLTAANSLDNTMRLILARVTEKLIQLHNGENKK